MFLGEDFGVIQVGFKSSIYVVISCHIPQRGR